MAAPLEAVRTCLQRGLTFTAFRWEGHTQLWVQRRPRLSSLRTTDLDAVTDRFIVAPFHRMDGRCWSLQPDVRLDLDQNDISTDLLRPCEGSTLAIPERPVHWDQMGHAKAIAKAQDAFNTGTLHKVVLSRTWPVPLPIIRISELFFSALSELPDAFVCLFSCPEHGTWLGASPERLIHACDHMVQVDSIAGTMPASQAPALADDWGVKERDEQEWVTKAVTEVFASAGMNDIHLEGPKVLKAGPVAHLHTELSAHTKAGQLGLLVNALHPTPAVCGTPRGPAMEFILAHEPQDRGLYAGYWGPWQVNGRSELFVNIRCMRVTETAVELAVGGGITSGSNAALEWQETEHKARTWTRIIEALTRRIS
jgi:isochorismate synthase